MDRNTYREREAALLAQLDEQSRSAARIWIVVLLCGRLAILGCAAFGVCATAGISLWFSPLVAVALMTTVGRVWGWARRPAMLEMLEHVVAEKTAPTDSRNV